MVGGESSPLLVGPPDVWFLRTPTRKWISLCCVTLAASLSQVPQMSWQTIEPMMLDDGVHQCVDGQMPTAHENREAAIDQLNTIYNLGLGLCAVAQLFEGLLFDVIGPRRLGMFAAVVTVVGYALMGLALQAPCELPQLLWASILAFVAAPAQALAANAYLYILSDSAFAVSAITNSAYVIAQVYGLIGGRLHISVGATSYAFFYVMAAANLLALVVYAMLLPPHSQFAALQAHEMARQKREASSSSTSAGSGSGGGKSEPLAAAKPDALAAAAQSAGTCDHCMTHTTTSLRDAVLLVRSPIFGWTGAILVAHVFALYMLQTLFLIEQYHYYDALFGSDEAEDLVNVYALVFAVGGIPVSLVGGLLADSAPPSATVVVWDLTAAVFTCVTIVNNRGAQYASMGVLTVLANVYYLATPPLVMFYAPAELFGTLFGALQALIGVLQILLVSLEDAIASALAGGVEHQSERVVGKLLFWTAAIVVLSAANLLAWRSSPPPALGSVTMADVRKAS